MHVLPAPLAPLAAYNQFVLYKLVPQPDGKTAKIPLSWQTLAPASAHDPANWLSADLACAWSLATSHHVGFAFTANDPFWFIDLDDCLTPTGWSAEATAVCHALPGVAIEVSQSGRGLHLIGTGTPPPHATAPNDRLGLYTAGRFVALTGAHATGSAATDCTATLPAVVARWFPPRAADLTPAADWTTAPVPEWRGPLDDDALIAKALASVSAAGAFGSRATMRQLWKADPDALGAAYPAVGRPYDASAADSALAAHLAWWTGRDCARIERLMRQSDLARGKWDERPEYLRRTILAAVAVTTGCMTGPATATVTTPGVHVGRVLGASELAEHFAGCVYIEDRYAAAVPDGSILEPQQFRAAGRYGGHRYMLDESKQTRNAWEAFSESGSFQPPFAHSMCFRPELPARSLVNDNGRVLFNCYVPAVVASTPGDAGPMLRHIAKLLPNPHDYDRLLHWMASAVQNPGVKFQWAVLLQGVQGNGKTLIIEAMVAALGERYSHIPNAQDISNKFNGWLENKLFIGVEEIKVGDRQDLLDTLKVLVTNRRIEIQHKGRNQVTGDNRANFMLATNHKDALPKTLDDRRYCVMLTAQQSAEDLVRDGMSGSYFPVLYEWARNGGFAAFTHHLQHMVLRAELDPARLAHRAPDTTTTAEAIEASAGPVEQAVREAIGAGEVGFRGGWVSSTWLAKLLGDHRLRLHSNQWDSALKAMGYVKHPSLPGGRLNNPVMPDGKKSRLWVKADTIPALNLHSAAAVAAAYAAANGMVEPVARSG